MKHAGEKKLVRHNKASLIAYAADHAKSLKATTVQPVAALRPRPSLDWRSRCSSIGNPEENCVAGFLLLP